MRSISPRCLVALFVVVVLALGIAAATAAEKDEKTPPKPAVQKLPKLVDLGSTKCIPCKMMVPVLSELSKDYKGQLDVQFIDVQKDPQRGRDYRITSIPTQVLFDSKGKEITRHSGYWPKDDILKAFKEHGIKFKAPVKPKQ